MATSAQQITQDLLARSHSPDSVSRIYREKIQYRQLHLKPTSPPPSTVNARAARKKARQQTKATKKLKPKPLSSRERRQLGLYDIPRQGQKYEIYEPLNRLWMDYMRELLGNDVYVGGPSAAAKLASAEFVGASVEVVRSRCPSRVGVSGIVVRDCKFVFEVVTKKRALKIVPKEGTTFRTEVTVKQAVPDGEGNDTTFAFEVLGDQLLVRSADRANRKFRAHFLKEL